MKPTFTTQKQVRAAFWETHPNLLRSKLHGDYHVDTRIAFVDYVDMLARDGQITETLAHRVTL